VVALLKTQAAFSAGDTVTLSDTGTAIDALTAAQFGLLAARGIDQIDATNNTLSLSTAQYLALGATSLTQADAVTLVDSGAHVAALTATQIGQLAANGIDRIDTTNNVMALSVAQFEALGSVTLTQTDAVTLKDTGAHLAALTASDIAALAASGIDQLNASNGSLTFSLDQFEALGTVKLTPANTVTLADTGAALSGLSAAQIGALRAAGIDRLDATDDTLSLSVAQFHALHQVALTQADAVTLSDTGANLGTFGAAAIGALAQQGVDALDATDNAITFNLAQYNALGTVHVSLDDVITVNGTAGTDLIQGKDGSEVLNGGAGDDVLFGEGGNDVLDGGAGNDTLNGGDGADTATYADATAGVTVDLTAGTASGGAGADLLSNIESVTGSAFGDTLHGSSGANTLDGGAGDDFLIGAGGGDRLTGGTGADTFVYQAVSDSATAHPDLIMDFSHADGDKIDVSAIASFTFVDHLTHHADQLAVVDAGHGVYKVVADINGDGVADLTINVHSASALVAGDFIF
jgi:Ca2+-binding RTX toxin-like protein